MRIAVYHNQPSGGARRALYELGRQLARRHVLDVYTLSTSAEEFLPSSDFAAAVRVRRFAPHQPVRFGLYLNEFNRLRDLRALEHAARAIAARIDAGGYDAVWLDVCRFTGAPSVARYLATPNVYYCHEPPRRFLDAACRPDPALMTRYERARQRWHAPANWLYDRAAATLDRRNVRAAGTVLTNSQHTRANIHRYYGIDAAVCPLGVDTLWFRPVPAAERGDYLLSVGAIEPHKGYEFLIRALGRVPPSLRPRLVLAGNTDSGGHGTYLRRVAARHAVQLDLALNLPMHELLCLYQRARAFAYTPHQEPFGLAVLEAMACALPVIAVDEGGPRESVLHEVTGLLAPRDEERFAAALARVLSDERHARALGEAGRRHVEETWTWEAAAARVAARLVRSVRTPLPSLSHVEAGGHHLPAGIGRRGADTASLPESAYATPPVAVSPAREGWTGDNDRSRSGGAP